MGLFRHRKGSLSLINLVKASVHGKTVTPEEIKTKLNLSDRTLHLGLKTLEKLGFYSQINLRSLQMTYRKKQPTPPVDLSVLIDALQEEQFLRQYFYKVPLKTVQNILYAED